GPASEAGEEILIATINLGVIAEARALSERNDAIGDRRSDVYG
ncbi:MAG: hydratase, partial [Mesorhizobium sp.]